MKKTHLDIFYCYKNGDLSSAMFQAYEFVGGIDESKVIMIASEFSDTLGWTVKIFYEKEEE